MSEDGIKANCSICGNSSSYDEESLKASTHIVNGEKIVLCCPCEDDILKALVPTKKDYDIWRDEQDQRDADILEEEAIEYIRGWKETHPNEEITLEEAMVLCKDSMEDLE